MPFQIIRNDITDMAVDAIVNTANPFPVVGAGVDASIHQKAGPELLRARQVIGNIDRGCAAVTSAYDLRAKYVIHTVGPIWVDGKQKEESLLRSCYENCLRLALAYDCHSIAFPLISTGTYGFPKDKALQIAISIFSDFLLAHEMQVYLVVFDRTSYKLSEKLFQGVASYIDQHYADQHKASPCKSMRSFPFMPKPARVSSETLSCDSAPLSLEEMLKQADAGFTETLLKLIDQSGQTDAAVYKRAGLTKQHFSKIRNDPNYKPKKSTAVALALALELNVEETNDLIGRAGFTLSNSSKFDLIIRYFIEQRNFNIVEINIALYEFDQILLGA